MKKTFTILLLIGSGLTAMSQEKGSIEFGANIGYNLSTVTTSSSQSNDSYRPGFNVTGFGDYFFSDRWSLKAKVSYDQKGWNDGFVNFDFGDSYSTDFQINYLTIPVMANWHFGRTRNWYLNFGPYAGILLNAKETAFNTDIKQYLKSTDAGLALGIGVKIPVASNIKILLETDGQASVTDIFKENSGETILNNRTSFNVGLVFGI